MPGRDNICVGGEGKEKEDEEEVEEEDEEEVEEEVEEEDVPDTAEYDEMRRLAD